MSEEVMEQPVITEVQAKEAPIQEPVVDAQATPSDGEKSETVVTADDVKKLQKHLQRTIRQRAEYKAQAEFYRQQAENQAQALQPKPQQVADSGAPKLENFTDIAEWESAVKNYQRQSVVQELTAQQQRAQAQALEKNLIAAWDAKVTQAETRYDDFHEKVGELRPTTPAIMAIMESENGADIAYHLVTHPKEAARIGALHPIAQAREIGRLDAKFSNAPPKAQISKAPAPITPLTGVGVSASQSPSLNDDMKTWIAKRQKQVYGR